MSDKNVKDSDIVERLRRLEEQVLPRGMNPAEGGSFSETITDENGDPIYDAELGQVPAAKIDPAVISSFNYTQDTEPSDPAEGESWYDTGSDAAYVFTDDVGSKQKINIVSHGELADVTPYAHQQPFYRQDTKPTDAIEGAMWVTESDGSGNDTVSRYQYDATADIWELNSAVGPSEPTVGTAVAGATWRDTANASAKQYDGSAFVTLGITDHSNLTNVTANQHLPVVSSGEASVSPGERVKIHNGGSGGGAYVAFLNEKTGADGEVYPVYEYYDVYIRGTSSGFTAYDVDYVVVEVPL